MSVNLKVKFDVPKNLALNNAKQVPFALSLALNETAKLAQLRIQQSLDTRFTIAPSRQEFFRRLVKIPKGGFATKNNPRVELELFGPNNAPGRVNLLKRHVKGGTFTEHDPLHPFFIPAKGLRPGAFDLPPRALYPKNLRLQDRKDVVGTLPAKARRTKKGGVVITSTRPNTRITKRSGKVFFLVPFDNPKGRTPGIYVRKAKDQDVELLWLYTKRITIPPRLPFEADVREVFSKRFDAEFSRAFARAVATARK